MQSDIDREVTKAKTHALAYGLAAEIALGLGNLAQGIRWGEASDKEAERAQNLSATERGEE